MKGLNDVGKTTKTNTETGTLIRREIWGQRVRCKWCEIETITIAYSRKIEAEEDKARKTASQVRRWVTDSLAVKL